MLLITALISVHPNIDKLVILITFHNKPPHCLKHPLTPILTHQVITNIEITTNDHNTVIRAGVEHRNTDIILVC